MDKEKIKTAHIISIGDELLSGHTINTNSSYIASELYDIGIKTAKIIAVPDSAEGIISELDKSLKEAEFIFITGGLGPTNDDLTKKVICAHFGFKMKFVPEVWDHIVKMFAKRGIVPHEVNKEQAMFPDAENAILLHNAAGTAPGMHFVIDGRHIFAMPGVPNEMRYLMDNEIVPLLKKEFADDLYYFDINTTGISESSIYAILSDHPKFPFGCEIAFLPQGYGVTIRIKNFGERASRKSLVDSAAVIIRSLAGDNVFTENMKSPQHELVELLISKKMKISAAESCTGGLLMNRITDVPGSSEVFSEGFVTYSNESKFKILCVNPGTLSTNGAVSQETVSEMLDGLFAETQSDIVCAVSGIAGPGGGSENKPAGTVYLGFGIRSGCKKIIEKHFFTGDRISVKEKSANKLMVEMIRYLKRNY
ncbi:MAG TPA: CinA family nicotinamide mononucleotide deamidase-related protein [Clostridiales bacterium]|nr:CinA family nicotinamide mononucleotide deamidase-related protein [Clostridiales bacterium]HQP70642.1 CinA family nicotinamide mononucleotide deamidase-related protein [Clostridiales bacterium]